MVQEFLKNVEAMENKPTSATLIVKNGGTELIFIHENGQVRKLILGRFKILLQEMLKRTKVTGLRVEDRSLHKKPGSKIIVSGNATLTALLKSQIMKAVATEKETKSPGAVESNKKKSFLTIKFE